jgi:hypothetical protein
MSKPINLMTRSQVPEPINAPISQPTGETKVETTTKDTTEKDRRRGKAIVHCPVFGVHLEHAYVYYVGSATIDFIDNDSKQRYTVPTSQTLIMWK